MTIASIRKRDGRLVPFDEKKIEEAITKAFNATYKPGYEDTAKKLSDEVLSILEVELSLIHISSPRDRTRSRMPSSA